MTDGAPALTSVRVCNDQKGNLQVLVMGRGPFPVLAWTVPRVFVDQLLVDESGAMVQCDAEIGGVSLHWPPGQSPEDLGRYGFGDQSGPPETGEPREHAAAE